MSASDASNGHRSGLRILIVEDEELIALLVEDMLAELGHKVVGRAARLNQAVDVASNEALDIAILDLNLKGEDTYPVAAALAARGIPFIFSTGYARGGLREPFAKSPVLQKPFQQDDLQKLLERMCPAGGD